MQKKQENNYPEARQKPVNSNRQRNNINDGTCV